MLALACERSPERDEANEAARDIARDGNHASEIIKRIRALLRKSETAKRSVNINQIIEEVVMFTSHEAATRGVTIRTELAEDVSRVPGDLVQLQQVVLNLVLNGIEAMAPVTDRPRELIIRSSQPATNEALVTVRDTGMGMDQENSEIIFDPFYTTKPLGWEWVWRLADHS